MTWSRAIIVKMMMMMAVVEGDASDNAPADVCWSRGYFSSSNSRGASAHHSTATGSFEQESSSSPLVDKGTTTKRRTKRRRTPWLMCGTQWGLFKWLCWSFVVHTRRLLLFVPLFHLGSLSLPLLPSSFSSSCLSA